MTVTSPRRFTRRAALRAAAIATGAFALVPTLASCADDAPPEPDPLSPLAARARADAQAAAAAVALAPDRAAALTVVAEQRTEHADALDAEIARALGRYEDGTIPETAPTPEPTPPAPPTSLDEIRDRLREAAREAADTARTQDGHRAGLLASIAAACRTHVEVQLP
ncbi:hypothetical protein DW322_12330 [Rhodococcus rhodnii]|uniref:DUF4439 domain-containing protein n=2 Tax=Rhodococcus rhodnii TaxID=38312 RepID=R7WL42_9NOCA|nr:hypothetical protein [Rhodococcus rhodnii]EOM76036.1 hypothetical protein Rrhod_2684 [Rhodococcus rhodnii LMG 5362]TXG92640.1 hypothetical protein DW322_12330 [Rhodococcus rhodnii]